MLLLVQKEVCSAKQVKADGNFQLLKLVKLSPFSSRFFHRHVIVLLSYIPSHPYAAFDSGSLSNLCISWKYKSEFIGAGLMAFINLRNSEMFDWNMAFPP